VGDDWQWLEVRRAVVAFAAEAGVQVASHPKENWWLLEARPIAMPTAATTAAEPAPKRTKVEFERPAEPS